MPWTKRSGSAQVYRTPEHRAARKRLIAAFTAGDPCCLPRQPLPYLRQVLQPGRWCT